MATPASGADAWLTINNRPLYFGENHENEHIGAREYQTSFIDATAQAPRHLQIYLDEELLQSSVYGNWRWEVGGFAGLYKIRVEAPDHVPQRTSVRVFPHKFTQRNYERMQEDLATIAQDLLFRLLSPAAGKAAYVRTQQDASPLLEYRKVREIIAELGDIMAHIRRSPYCSLHTRCEQQCWHELHQFTADAVPLPGEVIALQEQLSAPVRHLPQFWAVQQSTPTYDVYENRLLKQFLLKQLIARLSHIQESAQREKVYRDKLYQFYLSKHFHGDNIDEELRMVRKLERVILDCQQMKQRSLAWCNEPFFKTVQPSTPLGKATQVLLKHPEYSRFYRLYLRFQQKIHMLTDTTHYITELTLRRVSELYEMWSVFKLTHLAMDELSASGYRFISNTTFYEIDKSYFHFEVRKNVSSMVLEKAVTRVEIKYEPLYPHYTTLGQRSALASGLGNGNYLTPDLAIEIYQQDVPVSVLIFDAKYRYYKKSGHPVRYYPKDEDIDTMHKYYNSIVYYRPYAQRCSGPQLQKIVSSAYVLYPGTQLSHEAIDPIGGLPLSINMPSQRYEVVKAALRDLLHHAGVL